MINLNLSNNEKIAFIGDLHLDSSTPPSRIDDILQTTLDKVNDVLESCISNNVKALFWAGDIVNRISIPFSPINSFMELLIKFHDSGIQNFSICGNHDIMRNSMEYLDRSPVQTLFSSGLMTHISLNNRVCINNMTLITPIDYTETPPNADTRYKINILLCHSFINANEFMAEEKHNIRTEDLVQLDYDIVVAGHDHQYYPPMKIGKSMVYRPGSVLRGTSHDYNFIREPQFLIMSDVFNVDSIEKVIIKHKPYKDVASQFILNKKEGNSLSDLRDVLSNLAERLAVSSSQDEDRVMEIIKTDPNLPNDSRLQLLHYIGEIS